MYPTYSSVPDVFKSKGEKGDTKSKAKCLVKYKGDKIKHSTDNDVVKESIPVIPDAVKSKGEKGDTKSKAKGLVKRSIDNLANKDDEKLGLISSLKAMIFGKGKGAAKSKGQSIQGPLIEGAFIQVKYTMECHDEPIKQCTEVKRKACHKEPIQKCDKVPRESCSPTQKCSKL